MITDFAKGTIWGIRPGAMESMLRNLPNAEALSSLSIKFKEDPEDTFDFQLRDLESIDSDEVSCTTTTVPAPVITHIGEKQ